MSSFSKRKVFCYYCWETDRSLYEVRADYLQSHCNKKHEGKIQRTYLKSSPSSISQFLKSGPTQPKSLHEEAQRKLATESSKVVSAQENIEEQQPCGSKSSLNQENLQKGPDFAIRAAVETSKVLAPELEAQSVPFLLDDTDNSLEVILLDDDTDANADGNSDNFCVPPPPKIKKLTESKTLEQLGKKIEKVQHSPPESEEQVKASGSAEDNVGESMNPQIKSLEILMLKKFDQTFNFLKEIKDLSSRVAKTEISSEEKECTGVGQKLKLNSEDQYLSAIKKCTSVTQLCETLEHFQTIDGHLQCTPCILHRSEIPASMGVVRATSFGIFKVPHPMAEAEGEYEDDDEDEFDEVKDSVAAEPAEAGSSTQNTRTFKNFRKSILRHLQNTLHIWCESREYGLTEERIFTSKEMQEYKIGLKVARIAYSAVKEGKGGKYFERELNIQNLNGVALGEINHSREFYRKFRDCLFDVIRDKIMNFLQTLNPATNHLPLFSLTADKITLQKRTLQITCIIVMIKGEKRAILIDLPVCGTSHTGDSLSALLEVSMNKFKLDCKGQLNGLSFDGQYFDLSIPEKIAAKADLDYDFLSPQWDMAHKIELALGNCRESKSLQWLKKQIQTVSLIMKRYRWGISFEKFIRTAEDLEVNWLTPKGFQDTRFVQSEVRVYTSFERNFKIFFIDLSQQLEEAIKERDNTLAKELKTELNGFSKVEFVIQLLGTKDILNLITKLSCDSQLVDISLWDIYEKFSTLQKKLEKIKISLESHEVPSELKSLAEAFSDLKISVYQGVPLSALDDEPDKLRSSKSSGHHPLSSKVSSALKNLGKFAGIVKENLANRIEEPKFVPLMRVCFSWKDILYKQKNKNSTEFEEPSEEIKESLKVLFGILRKNRNLDFIYEDVLKQFLLVWKSLKYLPIVNFEKLPEPLDKEAYTLNRKITHYMFIQQDFYSKCPDFLFLFENFNQAVNESICETIGSVIGSHLHNRNVNSDNLCKEVFISWNGPKIHKAENILKEALDKKFSGNKPHFLVKSRLRVMSKVLERLRKEESNLAFLSD